MAESGSMDAVSCEHCSERTAANSTKEMTYRSIRQVDHLFHCASATGLSEADAVAFWWCYRSGYWLNDRPQPRRPWVSTPQ